MPDSPVDRRKHFVLVNTSTPSNFTAHRSIVPKKHAERDRQSHGTFLKNQLETLKAHSVASVEFQRGLGFQGDTGVQVVFEGPIGAKSALEGLSHTTKGIELLSIKQVGLKTVANVFVPEGKLSHYEKYFDEYLADRKNKDGLKSLDHKALVNEIDSIASVDIKTLWTDDPTLLPVDVNLIFWWEVWLPVRRDRAAVVADFRAFALSIGCLVSNRHIDFPERSVVALYASRAQLGKSIMKVSCIAELRKAKETSEFFTSMGVSDQREWLDSMLVNTHWPAAGAQVPYICLVDTGVNRGHPLLQPLMESADLFTIDPSWGVDDQANHGTGLAGLAGYGELSEHLANSNRLEIGHRLESSKVLPTKNSNDGDAKLHGDRFAQAVSYPEIANPTRLRVFSSAITANDYRDRGAPSSWSATIDKLAADSDGVLKSPRLFILSAGNTVDNHAWAAYPESLETNLINDPGQAWNALTVGACTFKTETEATNYAATAPAGALSPYTTTSLTWDKAWPLKPDVVFEGGNTAKDSLATLGLPALQLLTTNNKPTEKLFATTYATSASSALCANMAAQVMAAYPTLKPETIRGLIVHSAEWTATMKQMYLIGKNPSKSNFAELIRRCGWGVPNLGRALWSAGNSLTLIAEDQLTPYRKKASGDIGTKDINLHAIPWPIFELQNLFGLKVRMKVTLSYFIEPNPSARGVTSKFHYPSHRLKFDVMRPLEASTEDFLARLSAQADLSDSGEEVESKIAADNGWLLGERQRFRGSLHQDVWEGTATELASRGQIAVYPGQGWWRTRKALGKYDSPARYSLIVSITTEQNEIDLYSAVENLLSVKVSI
jgi:Subtilase family